MQQRIRTPLDLAEALRTVGRVRRKQAVRLAVHDIAGGAEALSEIDVWVAIGVPSCRAVSASIGRSRPTH